MSAFFELESILDNTILNSLSKLRPEKMGDQYEVFIAFVRLVFFSRELVPFKSLPDPSTVDRFPTDV